MHSQVKYVKENLTILNEVYCYDTIKSSSRLSAKPQLVPPQIHKKIIQPPLIMKLVISR